MSRLQPFAPLLRSSATPRALACRQSLRFSTASRLQAAEPSSNPSDINTNPPTPSRAAALAAAEAITESDSAQPPASNTITYTPSTSRPSQQQQPQPSFRPRSPFSTQKFRKPPVGVHRTPVTPEYIRKYASSLPSPPAYHISRSATKNLPIYTDFKRGGNLKLTTIRKITGDANALAAELRDALGKSALGNEGDVKVNWLTGHVVVKGLVKEEVRGFLEGRGL